MLAPPDRLVLAATEASAILNDGRVLTLARATAIARNWDVPVSDLMEVIIRDGSGG